MKPVTHHCRRHDYVYYPIDWVDSATNAYYKKGFYDENGQYYDKVAIKKKTGDAEAILTCEYCDTKINAKWDGSTSLTCPNCGASLVVSSITEDEEIEETYVPSGAGANGSNGSSPISKIIILIVSIMIGGTAISTCSDSNDDYNSNYNSSYESTYDSSDYDYDDDYDYQNPYDNEINNQSYIYVDELGRKCKWSDENGSYYDEETDCYFVYLEEETYSCWQYWYEGISSDFGEYGWMEWDENEQLWYIQDRDGSWMVLPGKYNKDYLWYIHE